MTEKQRSRWLRFGLRGMFVIVTVLCCWLGWATSVVRERKALLKELTGKGVVVDVTTVEMYKQRYPPGVDLGSLATVPRMRRWLGDEAIQEIWYDPPRQNLSEEQRQRLARIFPEAELREVLYEPCHPGCFPRGTLVATPDGDLPIESLRSGDWVTILGADQLTSTSLVQSVFITENRLWKVETDDGLLFTTETQPLCLSNFSIKPAGDLQPSDRILCLHDGAIHSVQVLSVSPTARKEKVFNLILGNSQVFVAGGYLARSKPPAAVAVR